MTSAEIIATFALAQGTAVQNVRVPKARFFELDAATASKRRLIADEVAEITLLSVFNTDTTNILSVRTDDVAYEEIYFFHVALHKDNHLAELHQFLQQHITNPAVIFFTLDSAVAIGVAPKRLNKAIADSTVIENMYLTDWLNLAGSNTAQYLSGGAVTNCSFINLERCYLDMVAYVKHAALLRFTDRLTIDRRRDWSTLDQYLSEYRQKTSEYNRLKEEEKSHTAFGDKLSLRSKQVAVERKLSEITDSVKNILENKA